MATILGPFLVRQQQHQHDPLAVKGRDDAIPPRWPIPRYYLWEFWCCDCDATSWVVRTVRNWGFFKNWKDSPKMPQVSNVQGEMPVDLGMHYFQTNPGATCLVWFFCLSCYFQALLPFANGLVTPGKAQYFAQLMVMVVIDPENEQKESNRYGEPTVSQGYRCAFLVKFFHICSWKVSAHQK